jgi:hypothetical protein
MATSGAPSDLITAPITTSAISAIDTFATWVDSLDKSHWFPLQDNLSVCKHPDLMEKLEGVCAELV